MSAEEAPIVEAEPLPKPDFYYQLIERQSEEKSPLSDYRNWFLGTPIPVTIKHNLRLTGSRRNRRLDVVLRNEDIERGFEESGNLIGLMHWRREQQALSLTGMSMGKAEAVFYHPESRELVLIEEIKEQVAKQKLSLFGRALVKLGL